MALFVCTKMKYPLLQKLAFWKSNWNSSSKSFSMVGNVNAVEKDQAGNNKLLVANLTFLICLTLLTKERP